MVRLLTCWYMSSAALTTLVGLVSALAGDQIDEFVDDADIGLLDVALQQGAQSFGAARGSDVASPEASVGR